MLSDQFGHLEEELRDRVITGEAPFLSLYAENLPEATRENLRRRFQSNVHGVEELRAWLLETPALTASHLTAELNAEMVGNEVYPHIQKAFRLRAQPTPKEWRMIWEEFRFACKRMGLQVSSRLSGPRFMVDEYIRQMGVPFRDAWKLARQMCNLADNTGFPDSDDPDSMELWKEKLIEQLNSSFPSTARRALELDIHAYYVRLFLEAVEKPDRLECPTAFQQKMVEALRTDWPSKHGHNPMAIPRPVLRDGMLGVLLPPRNGLEWTVEVDGELLQRAAVHEERFIPLVETLPRCVRLQAAQEHSWNYDLWPNSEGGMLLFGRRDSRLLHSISFGDESVFLEPGAYSLLSRFDPALENYGTEHVSEMPSLYLTRFELDPGNRLEITRGEATAILEAEALPLLRFRGESRSPLSGPSVFWGASERRRLELHLLLPPNRPGEADTDERDQGDRIVRIRSSLGGSLEFSVHVEEGGTVSIPLAEWLKDWSPGLALVTAECFKPATKRVLARCAGLVWNGLTHVVQDAAHGIKFCCNILPENLDREASDNLLVNDGEKRISIREKANRTCTTIFHDGSRRHSLTWAMPGIHIELGTIRNGQETIRPVRVGETLTVNRNVCEYLHVYGLERGVLRLANACWPVGDDQACRPIPLAVLRDEVTPDQRDLLFERWEDGSPQVLVHFVTPHHAQSFKAVPINAGLSVDMMLTDVPAAFALRTQNVCTGAVFPPVELLAPTDGETAEHFLQGGTVVLTLLSENTFRFRIETEGWPDGIWVVGFEANVGGSWGKVVNNRGDRFAYLLSVCDGSYSQHPDTDAIVGNLDSRVRHTVLQQTYRFLQSCFATEAWDSLWLLKQLWEKLLHDSRDAGDALGGDRESLLSLFGIHPPEDNPPSWLPFVHLAWARPNVLAWPAKCYQEADWRGGHFLRCLNALPMLLDPVAAFRSGDFSCATLMGFSNGKEVGVNGATPRSFSLPALLVAWPCVDFDDRRRKLSDQSWVPGRGEFLGPLQFRFAVRKLVYALERTAQDETRNRRRKLLASHIIRRSLSYHGLPLQVIGANQPVWEKFCAYEEKIDAVMDGQGAVSFLAAYAYRCRNAAHDSREDGAGSIADFLSRLLPDDSPEDRHHGAQYLVAVGEDLLGFFLLFWELLFQTRH